MSDATVDERRRPRTRAARPDEETLARRIARPPVLGDVVAEKYRLARTLGRGGMGRIFAAEHLMLHTTVALKFMHPHLARDPRSVARFASEARAAATLKSPHAARIIDVDQTETGELYIVMEYLDGESLETIAKDGRGLPIDESIDYMLQACDALAEAHDRGIVHRDVKPANLFRVKGKSGESMIKVLDFGLAKSADSDACYSGEPMALGTPQYMSPEQIAAKSDVDGRADVWAIGVTLYELLAGRPAYRASSPSTIFTHILYGQPASVLTHRPDVPASVVAIIERCMTRDRTARFATVRELAAALAGARDAMHALMPPPVAYGEIACAVAAQIDPRRTWGSLTPSAMSMPVPSPSSPSSPSSWSPSSPSLVADEAPEQASSLRQTILAALAGPALIAVAAAVTAIALRGGHAPARAAAAAASTATVAVAEHLGARSSASAPRGKAVTVTVSSRCARHPRSAGCVK